jgi:hypothetical protein
VFIDSKWAKNPLKEAVKQAREQGEPLIGKYMSHFSTSILEE